MSRPPGDAARKLLAAGSALAQERGCGAVSVRETCRRAKVNLGLFHYHFKTRDAFIEKILDEGYEEFFVRLRGSAEKSGTPSQRLRLALHSIALFVRERRRMCAGLLKDGLNGEKKVAAFMARTFPHHLPLILSIYEEGVRRGDFRRLSVPFFLSFCMGAMNAPGIMLTLFEEHGVKNPFDRPRSQVESDLFSSAALDTRLDMILSALETPRRSR